MRFTYAIKSPDVLKSFLQQQGFSKKTTSAIKQNGALLVNHEPVTVRYQLQPGDKLTIILPTEIPSANLQAFHHPLDIAYEDDYLLIVCKPSLQNCAPSREHPHESLIEQVIAYCHENDNDFTPHIVTRLDRNTTGLVLLAKHGHIHHLLSHIKINKRYIALCHGATQPEGIIEAPIARANDSIITRQVSSTGKYAKSTYRTLNSKQNVSLCEVTLHTGRTHQIRVHFQYIGHPLIGDALYGGNHDMIHNHCLQCTALQFKHPILHQTISITIDYKQLICLYIML